MTTPPAAVTAPDFAVGTELAGPARQVTMDRTGWYSIGMLAAATGERMPVQHNIHTDHKYARAQGLPAAIADGMHSTNWLSALLSAQFGAHYVTGGALRTKYIKPVIVDAVITPKAVVRGRDDLGPEGVRYTLDVWCEDQDGAKLTIGDATVLVTAAGPGQERNGRDAS
jgi:acyl dehydratase